MKMSTDVGQVPRPAPGPLARPLESLILCLTTGAHQELESAAPQVLDACRQALEALREAARAGQAPPAAAAQCLEVRSKILLIRSLLDHAEQVRLGLTGIVSLLHDSCTGARYSAQGTPQLPSVPRWVAEA